MLASAATDWIQASASIALVGVAVVGFAATIYSIAQTRNRQEMEIEGYIRVDVGPPQGTADFRPPNDTGRITKDIGRPYPDVFYGTKVETKVIKPLSKPEQPQPKR